MAVGVRKQLLRNGAFTRIDAFPQKDNRENRVFRDAKLSTAVFVFRKCEDEIADSTSFTTFDHPGRDLDEIREQVQMTREQVSLYDPVNCAIITCAQSDFELATRLMRTGRMRRLGEVAESFQGEVNETTQGRRGKIRFPRIQMSVRSSFEERMSACTAFAMPPRGGLGISRAMSSLRRTPGRASSLTSLRIGLGFREVRLRTTFTG